MKDEAPRLAIKLNNCASNDPCAICGDRTDPEVGPELFLKGTWELVCYECGGEYAPELVDMLFYTRHAKNERAIQRQESGGHDDPWCEGYDDPLYQHRVISNNPDEGDYSRKNVVQFSRQTESSPVQSNDPEIYPVPWDYPFIDDR